VFLLDEISVIESDNFPSKIIMVHFVILYLNQFSLFRLISFSIPYDTLKLSISGITLFICIMHSAIHKFN